MDLNPLNLNALFVNAVDALERGVPDHEQIINSSSSSSSSSDSEVAPLLSSSEESDEQNDDQENGLMFAIHEDLLFDAPQARIENYLDVVHQKSDEQFRKDFRLNRGVVYDLIEELDNSGFIPNHTAGKEKKSAEMSFLLFLSLVSSDEVFREAANLFGCGETTVFRVSRRITDWLLSIMPQHIVWPRGEDIRPTANRFAGAAGINKCIGAIDGSHIGIEKPQEYGRAYWCRKEKYSIVLQGVVNHQMMFTNVHCGDPGSYHDIRVLRRSELHTAAERNLEDLFPNDTFLLGDKGYVGVGKKWIVTPFKDYGNLSPVQIDFNRRVCSTRVCVEQAFGILKSRFRYLRGTMRLRDVHFAARLVVACCVLHNICIKSNDDGRDFMDLEDGDEEDGGEADSENSDDGNDNGEVRDVNNRTLTLFTQLYPGAAIPVNRRQANVNN
ncbi:Protein ALP1-like [Frankliniella fusca]|uniref:Protein ALP1-like n=1 Tax=Frankliniella fusca TaxID=407009 RepID=A0AAE1H578_9NEOP|nr:Protein ALP1-like [Frankliniella fusca]